MASAVNHIRRSPRSGGRGLRCMETKRMGGLDEPDVDGQDPSPTRPSPTGMARAFAERTAFCIALGSSGSARGMLYCNIADTLRSETPRRRDSCSCGARPAASGNVILLHLG